VSGTAIDGGATPSPNGQVARLRAIEQRILADGSVRISELAVALQVSEMTIRRDLDELEALGVARRVRGGAVAVGPEPFAERHRTNAKAKSIIADKLARLVPDRGTVAFDASTTVHRYASTLDGARDLTVVTNGIDTFETLAGNPGLTATLTGGTREPRTGSLVGSVATKGAEDFLFDVLVCSAAALDAELGSSEASLAEADVKRAMSRTSSRVVLAVDHSKLGGRGQARLFRPAEIDVLVTDLDPGSTELTPFRSTISEIR
jgi:DeoR family transcriptional regulator, fructose operon transcriptional repressor